METFLQDLRYIVRSLLRSPGFTIVAVLTLALGIGANSAIFSVVNGVLLEPFDYPEPDRLVVIYSTFPELGLVGNASDPGFGTVSPPEYRELQERSRSFSAIGAWRTSEASLSGIDTPVRVTAATVSAEFFTVLGVAPRLGRAYTREEETGDGERVAVLSDRLWRSAFGADPGVIGKQIDLNGASDVTAISGMREVIGVMPAGFEIPEANADIWVPAAIPDQPTSRAWHSLHLVARLAPGVTLEDARRDVAGQVVAWAEMNPGQHVPSEPGHPIVLRDFRDVVVGDIRPALLILLGAVGLVLLIACANVANLLLARAEGRQREIAIRVALGARRARLMRQFLTEGVVLATAGSAVGLMLGYWGVVALLAISPDSVPRASAIGLDLTVLLFTLGVAIVTGLLSGLAPMLHLSPRAMDLAFRGGGDRSSASVGQQRLRRTLVVAEIGLAVMLVIGSGLLIRSFAVLQAVEPGFDPDQLATFDLYLPEAMYPAAADRTMFYDRLAAQLEALPGVNGVAAMLGLPVLQGSQNWNTEFEGIERTRDGPWHGVNYYQYVSGDYFETMRIPIIRGRPFGPGDDGTAMPVVIVNESLARMFYPGEDPIGRRVRADAGEDEPWFTIIGVARDVKQGGLAAATGTELYFYNPQFLALGGGMRSMHVVVRSGRDPRALFAEIRGAVNSVDAALPISNLRTMDATIAGSISRPRFLTLLLTIFAGVALALAAVGTYGVLSYSVAKRTREIGIRMAMGAEDNRVIRMVLGDGSRLIATGLAAGLLGAFALTRLLASLLFGISTTDPTTYLIAPALLTWVALAACYLPARRATRVDPMVALRAE